MSSNTTSNGIGTLTLMVVIFFCLRVTDVTQMDWIWVFSPWWIALGALLGAWLLGFTLKALFLLMEVPGEMLKKRRRRRAWEKAIQETQSEANQ